MKKYGPFLLIIPLNLKWILNESMKTFLVTYAELAKNRVYIRAYIYLIKNEQMSLGSSQEMFNDIPIEKYTS